METEELVKALGNLTVVELIALTKKLEEQWGVTAQPQVSQAVPTQEETKPVVAQTEFNVILTSVAGDKRIEVIKVVRELVGLGLKESKDLVDAAPKTIKESVSKADAEAAVAKLTAAGAVAEMK